MTKKPLTSSTEPGDNIILVAEDDDISFALIEILLSKRCKKLIRANTGEQAIRLFSENPEINLILMDLKMPVMDGYEATRQIRKLNSKIPIIAQTAYALTGDEKKALEAGCNDYVSKPINKESLFEKINEFINHRK